jgi:hypothetical protein
MNLAVLGKATVTNGSGDTRTAKSREWWRHEAGRLGSDWNAIMELRASVAPLTCDVCGSAPCVNPSFCAACSLADQQRRGLPQRGIEHRRTPQTTIEAIIHCVRERGLAALEEPANVERLDRCDRTARAQINERITRLIEQKGSSR